VKAELIQVDAVDPVRYWPVELYRRYLDSTSS
jgi:hypothetical protein